jgi:hypothetical protein
MASVGATNDPRRWQPIATLGAISWLGLYLHNTLSLPALTPLSPENSLAAFVALALIVAWWLLRGQRAVAALIFGWAMTHLVVGAIFTVIPFPLLPFYPEQTAAHYLAHLSYGLARLPLIGAMVWHLRASPQHPLRSQR